MTEELGASPPKASTERGGNIVRGITSLTAQNVGTSALAFAFLAVLLRLLPNIEYGVYSAVSIAVNFASVVSTLGLQYAAARYLSLAGKKGQSEVWIETRRILVLSLLITSGVTVAFEVLSLPLSIYFTRSSEWTYAFALGGFWSFSTSISLVLQGVLQGLKKYASLAKILLVSRFVMVVVTSAALVVWRNVSVSIIGWVIYSLIICAWIGSIVVRYFANHSEKVTYTLGYSQIMRYSFPLGIAGLLTVATSSADLIVVGGYLHSGPLGVYNTAVTISTVLTYVLVTPLVTAFLPEISSAQGQADLANGFRLAMRFAMLVILPASVFVALIPRQLLILFSGGGAYLAGSGPLQIISLFYVFLAVQTVIISLLQATGNTRQILVINALTTVVDLALSIQLVPHVGLMGAATARATTEIFGMAISIYAARRFVSKFDPKSFYLRALVCSLIPFFVIWGVSFFLPKTFIMIIPYSLAATVIFAVCLRALHVLTEEDRALVRHILPRRVSGLLRYL